MTEVETIEWVYDQLEDDESKFIFDRRRQFNLLGSNSPQLCCVTN